MRLLDLILGKSRKKKTAKPNFAATLHNPNEELTGDNLSKWHFDELIKTLITLSSPVDRQFEICGIGNPNSEMVEDFVWHYIDLKDELIIKLILTEPQSSMLDKITFLINKHSGKPDDDFWNPDNLKSHADWIAIRQIAKDSLGLLGKDNLQLIVVTTNKYDKSDKGEKLVIQYQKIDLIISETN